MLKCIDEILYYLITILLYVIALYNIVQDIIYTVIKIITVVVI